MLVIPTKLEDDQRMLSRYSTSPKGPSQPGSCLITMIAPKTVKTRQDDGERSPVHRKECEMTADYVLYDTKTKQPRVVGEVKTDECDIAESQNVFQVLAHVREQQSILAGFTAN